MNQIAIVGAGQLGRRHLQGLLKAQMPMQIHVVDPVEASRQAVDALLSTTELLPQHSVSAHAGVETLPDRLDLVVMATTAGQRLSALQQLLAHSAVRHLVLEKFLFNDSADYGTAAELLTQRGVPTWVNTPRRHFDLYKELRQQTRDDTLLQFVVDGGDWGLCCNSVHFMDLAQFLTGATELRGLSTRVDAEVLPSKREGYVELTGEVQAEVGTAQVTVRSIRGSTKPVTVTLHYRHRTVFIQEAAGQMAQVRGGQLETSSFRLPYQSEMTGTIAEQLLNAGQCDLTRFDESVAAHLPLLRAFAAHAGSLDGDRATCAIT